MSEFAITILASMGGSAALAGCLVWLSKTWLSERLKTSIQHEYNEKLEAIKAKLHAENSIALEQLKSDLRVAAQQRETQFSDLHKKRADTIEKLHALLQELAVAVAVYRKRQIDGGNVKEAQQKVDQSIESLGDYFRPYKIFLPKELEAKILELWDTIIDSARKVAGYAREGASEEQLAEANTQFDTAIRELFEGLKGEFRHLLGDDA